ncbi:hypothetical protein HZA99_01060 [Candidatus Woesearchaeota archaeon]|nr:hypothetical protein [Candidatus Woesearchaeota archaeon]
MTKANVKNTTQPRKFLHEHAQYVNERNFYKSLFAILLLIVATAFVLGRVGLPSENSGCSNFASNDLAGMAAGNATTKTITLDGENIKVTYTGELYYTGTNKERESVIYNSDSKDVWIDQMNDQKYQEYEPSYHYDEQAKTYVKEDKVSLQIPSYEGLITFYKEGEDYIFKDGSQILSYNKENNEIWSESGTGTDFKTNLLYVYSDIWKTYVPFSDNSPEKQYTYYNPGDVTTLSNHQVYATIYGQSQQTFTLVTDKGTSYDYTLVNINGQPYAKYVDQREKTKGDVYYYNAEGTRYAFGGRGGGVSQDTETKSDKSTVLVDVNGKPLAAFSEIMTDKEKINTFKKETPVAKETGTTLVASKPPVDYATIASSLGLSAEKGIPAVQAEDEAINKYLDNHGLEAWDYSVATGKYSCGSCGISYNSKGALVVKTAISDDKGNSKDVYVYEQKNGLNPVSYYVCETSDCEKGTLYTGNQRNSIKDAYKEGKREADGTEKTMQRAMDSGKDIPLLDADGTQLTDKDGKLLFMKSTLRQRAYMDKIYKQQEAQVVGLLSGYLNNWIDEKLGSWSRGVPAGICKYIFGFDYYKNAGWVAVPANTSSSQLQSQLIANSRTVMIEGEKEEITENLFRYAYTIRLLANQSLEWQTYLSNSCSGKTSVEQFYDYGALAPGAYYAFHYAGSGEQDMTFDCTQEDCLYDQACVAFTDGTAPVCVSLVHGAGFETPKAGDDYDCL